MQQNTIGALGRLGGYKRVLMEHSEIWAGATEYYWCTRKVGRVQESTNGALGSLGWYSRII